MAQSQDSVIVVTLQMRYRRDYAGIKSLAQASFLRGVTALGGTVQEAAPVHTCLLRAFSRSMVHTCPYPSLMEQHEHT